VLYRKTVATAARALDTYALGAWWDEVNLELLNLDTTTRCVLGQVFGTFNSLNALRVVHLTDRASGAFHGGRWPRHALVASAWRHEVTARRRAVERARARLLWHP
jgi:hypothetical protein